MNGHEYNIGIDLEKSCNTSTYFEDYTLKQNGKVQDKWLLFINQVFTSSIIIQERDWILKCMKTIPKNFLNIQ